MISWNETNSIIYNNINTSYSLPKIKIAGFDLDHTIIRPNNSRIHPKNEDDFEYVSDKLTTKLIELHKNGFIILIFSNQDKLNSKLEKKKIVLHRINRLYEEIFLKNNIPVQFYISILDDYCRKPNIGMMEFFLKLNNINLDISNSFYVGDAAGRTSCSKFKKDFSCSDRMFALNNNIEFMTPEKFYFGSDLRNFELKQVSKKCFIPEDFDNKLIKEHINFDYIQQYNYIMLVGPPASGKTTFANLIKHQYNYEIISNDITPNTKKNIKMLEEFSKNKTKIIIDNTFSRKKSRLLYLNSIKKINPTSKILCIQMEIDKLQSLFLNNFRCKISQSKKISNIAIHSYFKYYENITLDEGFTEIIKIPFIPKFNNTKYRILFNQYF